MRADRLLKMLLLLQTGGRHTASELAEELEVSERTIYRDVVALSISGFPVFTEKGPGGGIQLIEEYRTSLTGLSPEEVKALFMLNVPAAVSSLGMSDEIKGALLKLSAALPKYLQEAQTGVQQRIIIDLDWQQKGVEQTTSHLEKLYRAVWEDRCIRMVIRYMFGYSVEHVAQAVGLVSRGMFWYLVCRVEGVYKIFSLDQIASLEILDQSFERRAEFDLSAFWQKWLDRQRIEERGYLAVLSSTPGALDSLRIVTQVEVVAVEEDEKPGMQRVTLRFESFSQARRTILGLGGACRIREPEALRNSVVDYAHQIIQQY